MSSTSKARYPRAVVILVLVITLIGLVAMFWRPGSGPSVGDRLDGGLVAGEVETSYARTPYGSMRISMTRGDVAQIDDSEQKLGEDAEWVRVSWEPNVAPGGAQTTVWPGATREDLQEPASRVILRADGTDHIVASKITSADDGGSAILAIEKADDLTVLVSTADGAARPTQARLTYPQVGHPDPVDCTARSPRRAGFDVEVGCSFEAVRALYVPGLGLAPTGKSWLVVRDVRVQERNRIGKPMKVGDWSTEEESVDYHASGRPSLRLEVSGADRPAKTAGRDTLTTDDPQLATRAYLVPAEKPATVTLHYTTVANPAPDEEPVAGAPKSKKISVRATVETKPDGSAAS